MRLFLFLRKLFSSCRTKSRTFYAHNWRIIEPTLVCVIPATDQLSVILLSIPATTGSCPLTTCNSPVSFVPISCLDIKNSLNLRLK